MNQDKKRKKSKEEKLNRLQPILDGPTKGNNMKSNRSHPVYQRKQYEIKQKSTNL